MPSAVTGTDACEVRGISRTGSPLSGDVAPAFPSLAVDDAGGVVTMLLPVAPRFGPAPAPLEGRPVIVGDMLGVACVAPVGEVLKIVPGAVGDTPGAAELPVAVVTPVPSEPALAGALAPVPLAPVPLELVALEPLAALPLPVPEALALAPALPPDPPEPPPDPPPPAPPLCASRPPTPTAPHNPMIKIFVFIALKFPRVALR